MSEAEKRLAAWAELLDLGVEMAYAAALARTGDPEAARREIRERLRREDDERHAAKVRILEGLARAGVQVRGHGLGQVRGQVVPVRRDGRGHLRSGRLEGPDGIAEMGSVVPLATGQRLVVDLPRVAGRVEAQPEPGVRARLYRIEAGGRRRIVAESGERIDLAVTEPGVYRVEVGIVPRHLEPWLGGADYLREVPWIYSNPIRVKPAAAAVMVP